MGGLLLWVLLGGVAGGITARAAVGAVILTVMGATSAAGSLALARRADDGEFLEAGESAGLFLDYLLSDLGSVVYNQAIRDAQEWFQERTLDLDVSCYKPELQYWPERRGK